MTVLIRNARPDDADAWLPLAEAFCAGEQIRFDANQRHALLAEIAVDSGPGELLVAEDDGRLVGFALIGYCFSAEFDGRFALLDELFVDTRARGQGLAARLINAVRERCRARGLACLRLEITDGNERAARVYEREGFRLQPRRLMTLWLAQATRD